MLGRSNVTRSTTNTSSDVVKPDTKPPATKRRPLVDITNAYSAEESKDNTAKKPTSQSSHSTLAEINIEVTSERDNINDREYMRRENDDIDARDAGNPLLATCYVNEMYANFGILEKQYAISPQYMCNQPYVNERMRAILADWLVSLRFPLF